LTGVEPPHFNDVPRLMDAFFSIIHENWTILEHPTGLAAFAFWNLNWIHPFIEGNGRTARAACYDLICIKQGKTSVITSKAANGYHFKTGQRETPRT
jgi:Fic family protein